MIIKFKNILDNKREKNVEFQRPKNSQLQTIGTQRNEDRNKKMKRNEIANK